MKFLNDANRILFKRSKIALAKHSNNSQFSHLQVKYGTYGMDFTFRQYFALVYSKFIGACFIIQIGLRLTNSEKNCSDQRRPSLIFVHFKFFRIFFTGPTCLGPKKHHSGPLEQQITTSKKIDTAHREKVQMSFKRFYCASTPTS